MQRKIKYQGGVTRFLCVKKAESNKKRFAKEIGSHMIVNIKAQLRKVDFELFSFSGASGFEDQMLSIYSFVFYAGVPLKWIIYSDKSYTEYHIRVFKEIFPFVEIKDWDITKSFETNVYVKEYLSVSSMAKKLNIILGHTYKKAQSIYVDSDIVFYKNIVYYLNSNILSTGLWYVPDTLGNVKKHFGIERESIYPLNSGLLILNKDFDFEDIHQYFNSLRGNYVYFSEQSSFEYALRKQGGQMLDPRQFIIDTSDQFDFSNKFSPGDIAMRHYTSPVRHKMWQKGWKWHFVG